MLKKIIVLLATVIALCAFGNTNASTLSLTDFESTIRVLPYERGAIYSADESSQVAMVQGYTDHIIVPHAYVNSIYNAIWTHNHPTGGDPNLSAQDLTFAQQFNPIQIRAVSINPETKNPVLCIATR